MSPRTTRLALLAILLAPCAALAQMFVPRTHETGLASVARTNGVALADYDGDGDVDVYFVVQDVFKASEPKTWNRLFANTGNGTFVDVTATAGVAGRNATTAQNPNGMGNKLGASWGDYDNDGWPDLFLTHYGANQLYHNNGDGTFTEVTAQAGITTRATQLSSSALWFDYDRDGDLDLYISIYAEFFRQPSERNNKLYENLGNGKFLDVSEASGAADDGATWTTVALDANHDGYLDLYLANDFGRNKFYLNRGNKTFQERTSDFGLEDPYHGMGLAIADCDANGFFDFYLTNISETGSEPETNPLFLNSGQNLFINKARESGVAHANWGWGTEFFDLENDGDEDLVIVTNNFQPQAPRVLFRNESEKGAALFTNIAAEANVADSIVSRGCAVFDYDNDGDVDVLVSNFYEAPSLYENKTPRGNWLNVKLEGVRSPRDAFGAVVEVWANGKPHKKYHHGAQFFGQNILPVHFGLSEAQEVERIIINWPSGYVDQIGVMGMNQTVLIKEGEGVISRVWEREENAAPPETLRLLGNRPNPFNAETHIRFALEAAGEVEIHITDLQGRTVRVLTEHYTGKGEKVVRWDATDWNAQAVSSGFYFYRLKLNGASASHEVGKMLCLR